MKLALEMIEKAQQELGYDYNLKDFERLIEDRTSNRNQNGSVIYDMLNDKVKSN